MLKLFFAGDFAPCRGFEAAVLENGDAVFGNLRDEVISADISFLNLEAPLCRHGSPIKKTGPNIRAHPDCIQAVADAGFDVAVLANNHIMDFGPAGLQETLNACSNAGVRTCGAGKNLKEARKHLLIKKQGLSVVFIAVAEHEFSIAGPDLPGAAPLDPIDNTRQIEAASKESDLVFVTIHGGNEHFPYPRPGLRKLCKYLIERGADGVICHHPHVPGACEFYQSKPIVYSLGNLIFDHPNPPEGWNQGYALRLEYDADANQPISHEFIPYTQSVKQGGVRKMRGTEKEAFFQQLADYKQTLSDDKAYRKTWSDFCNFRETEVLLKMFMPFQFRGLGKLSKYLPITKCILPKSSIEARKNLIQCESHRELLLGILEKK